MMTNVRSLSLGLTLGLRRLSTGVNRTKIEVDNQMIHYEKYGNGDHAVLLLPGALGTTQTDFSPQLEHLNREKLTIVAWDPPGYGYSRPPDRKFDMDMFEKDAVCAKNLMFTLGFEKFSLVGWSDGGITSLIIASRFQSAINKMVVFGANSYVSKKDVDLYEGIRDIEKWSERMISPMINLYGKEYFKKCWESWCDMCAEILVNKDGDLCQNGLKDITCPTLIIQGEKDPIVPIEHPYNLNANIKNSRLKLYPQGKHNLHLRYWKEFNKDVEDFLLE